MEQAKGRKDETGAVRRSKTTDSTREEIRSTVSLMRELGVTRLRTAALDIDLGPDPLGAALPAQNPVEEKKRADERRNRIMFAASPIRPRL